MDRDETQTTEEDPGIGRNGMCFRVTADILKIVSGVQYSSLYLITTALALAIAFAGKYVDIIGCKKKGAFLRALQRRDTDAIATEILWFFVSRTGASILIEAKLTLFTLIANRIVKEISTDTFYFLLFVENRIGMPATSVTRMISRGNSGIRTALTKIVTVLIPNLFFIVLNVWEIYSGFGMSYIHVLLVVNIFYVLATWHFTKKRIHYKKKINRHDDQTTQRVCESVNNAEVVKSYGNEHIEVNTFVSNVCELIKYNFKDSLSVSALNIVQRLLYSIVLVVILHLYYMGLHGSPEGVDIGKISTLCEFVTAVDTGLMSVAVVIKDISICYVDCSEYLSLRKGFLEKIRQEGYNEYCGKRVIEDRREIIDGMLEKASEIDLSRMQVLTEEVEVQEIAESDVTIEFQDVRFTHASMKRELLRGVSFKIMRGEKVALMGLSGSGKSTILSLLLKMHKYTGTILVNGTDIAEMPKAALLAQISFVTQDSLLFEESILYNIRYGQPRAPKSAVIKVVEELGLQGGVVASRSKGLDENVGNLGSSLSGGEKQVVAIARCLLKNAPIVVFDEATSKLESSYEEHILRSLMWLPTKTLLMVLHNERTALLADRIIYLEEGTVGEQE
jgi:ABC-type multidrug transport system fused ATPase/permease subunit